MDLQKTRYKTFDELYDYSYKVASVVGLMTSEVFGYTDKRALDYAVDLGIAMQLTNILRDVGEDLKRDRIYLPADELERFGIQQQSLMDMNKTPEFCDFMSFQIERARHYYDEADKGIAMLDLDSRLPVLLARENYSRILDKIEENEYNVFDQRAYLNSAEKFSIIPKVVYNLKKKN
jgi:phytoene synthase